MKRAKIAFLWTYRKEALALVYLFFVGMAFGAIWIFHDRNSENTLAFEEDHETITVEIIQHKTPETSRRIPQNIPDDPVKTPMEQAWKRNAVKVAGHVTGKAQISIVIDDLGVVRDKTRSIINLPGPLTLSFLPYAKNLKTVTALARDRGHELMIHLPMEPKSDKDPGPHALRIGVSDQQMLKDLYFNLSQFEGYVGLNNHMGSAFTENSAGLDLILTEVKKRGLLVLDSRTSRKSLLAKIASEKNIPNMTRDFFLDNQQNVEYILGQLTKLENMAQKKGGAIAIGHPYSETIEALSIWLPTLKDKGIVIVPLSHIIKRKYQKTLLARDRPELSPAH
ncbi:hypothetical protein MNBD_ALPHA01-2130 [hydrothermal vent metagenome]|uniref:Periplasmic protein YibQ, distant homology with nucleoside diphosphatase and polysaccharide deacetylase n=1 Tax=hydrothermal vent metagenome TaxID=652676 RepID=A0A3B0SLE0_9ZZZZ